MYPFILSQSKHSTIERFLPYFMSLSENDHNIYTSRHKSILYTLMLSELDTLYRLSAILQGRQLFMTSGLRSCTSSHVWKELYS